VEHPPHRSIGQWLTIRPATIGEAGFDQVGNGISPLQGAKPLWKDPFRGRFEETGKGNESG
jgi:hypothetical protein